MSVYRTIGPLVTTWGETCILRGPVFVMDKMCYFLFSATFWKKVELLLRPRSDTLHALLTEDQYTWLWSIVNFVPFLRDYVMKSVYVSKFFSCHLWGCKEMSYMYM